MAGNEQLCVADACALIGFLISDSRYMAHDTRPIVTTEFALLETYWYCLRTGIDIGDLKRLSRFEEIMQYPDTECLRLAAQLRFKYKREDLSYADCVGWALAQQLGIPFLTGDKAFKNKEGVAFVG